jgi:FtsP/CotA-like multicopper oxidase with cupredoxin domain
MRSNISTICSTANQPLALAAIFYDKADQTKAPQSTAWNVPDPGTCANDDLSLTVPFFPIKADTPSTTKNLDISFFVNSTGSFLWRLDGTSFRANYNQPVLLQAEQGNLTFPQEWNVKNFGSNTTIRIVVNNPTPASHPMHLHGHNMQILSEGPGNYDGTTIVNPSNPQRRDVQLVRANGHFAFQFAADNPGVWPFHCHIAWHVSGGLYANILERPADIGKKNQIPMIMQQTCTDWVAYTNKAVVDQVDSGV